MAGNLNLHTEALFQEAYGDRKPSFYSSMLANIIRQGKPGPILDLGAGLGLFTELVHYWGIPVTGLEGAEYAVAAVHTRSPSLNVMLHDLGKPLPFERASFANVVLNQVVEHLDPQRFHYILGECFRVLSSGGRLFINSPSRRNLAEQKEPTHINMLLPSELKQALVKHGFKIVSEPNYGFWLFPNSDGLVGAVAERLLRVLPHDWISATANAIAVRA